MHRHGSAATPDKYDYTKRSILAELRRKARLSQEQAAQFLSLAGGKGRDSVSAWELGKSRPQIGKRANFIVYLVELLLLISLHLGHTGLGYWLSAVGECRTKRMVLEALNH